MDVKKVLLVLPFLIINISQASGQVDDDFWFAPPSAEAYGIGDEGDIEIVITAMQATVVTIEQPATGKTFTTPTIPAFGSQSYTLQELGYTMAEISTPAQPLPLGGANPAFTNGLHITSEPGLITVSYKLMANDSQDQFSLKGKNALGSEFYVTTQNFWDNKSSNHYSGFTVVATEDNTTINIELVDSVKYYTGPFPTTLTFTLDKGETYTVQAYDNLASNHINGVRVTADTSIAISYWDDQVAKNLTNENNFKYDYAGDQLVPTSIIGTEYLVMPGGMDYVDPPGDGGERIFVTGTVDNSTVEIYSLDGVLQTSFVVNEGEVISWGLPEIVAGVFEAYFVRTTEPVYINHYASVNNGQVVSVSVLPPIGICTGSNDVVITRSDHSSDDFLLTILAANDTNDFSVDKNQAANNFTITKSDGTVLSIDPALFEYSDDSAYIVLNREAFYDAMISASPPAIGVGETVLIQNRIAQFHLGVVEGHKNSGGKYGYFSDYGGQAPLAGIGGSGGDALLVQCSLTPIRLSVTGGKSYTWTDLNDPANTLDYLSATNVANPIYYPDTFEFRAFNVVVENICGGAPWSKTLTILTYEQPIAYFDVESEEVCSPDSILITHGVKPSSDINMEWYFDEAILPGIYETSEDGQPFYHALPENNGDSTYPYRIELHVNASGGCPHQYARTITVKPAIHSEFEFIGDSIACHPLQTSFSNKSSGNIDSTSFLWDFGDLSISYEVDSVEHTYNNFYLSDTTYTVQLITRSPYDCLDTSSAQVTVYPRVKALFSTTPNLGCSPINVDINPVNSFGVDSLIWQIDYPDSTDEFKITNKNSFNITHEDITIQEGTDTLTIHLIAKNQFNCADTALPHNILVYPATTADFELSSYTICESDTVTYTNNSTGYHIDYFWNLGDGTAPNDTTPAPKSYYNPSSVSDTYYTIELRTISEHNCTDYKDTVLTVHPYLNANFGINYVKNCAPLNVNITNNSVGGIAWDWDMGDGSNYSHVVKTDFNHTYNNPSANNDTIYTIKLIAENAALCKDSLIRTLSVKPQVVAMMDLTNKTGCSPLTTGFTNNSTGGSYFVWELGGANIRTDSTPESFNQSYINETADDISYVIRLTARNNAGCDSVVSDTVNVFANIIAGFSFNKDSSCSPFTPIVVNNSSSGAKVFEWTENGITISTNKSPTPAELNEKTNYTDSPDYYDYELIAMGVGIDGIPHDVCADTHRMRLAIFPELDANFEMDETAMCQPIKTPITNNSYPTDSVSYTWYLDNYIYSIDKDPGLLVKENYTSLDQLHSLRLTGKTVHGCTGADTVDFTVYAYINANFVIDRSAICSDLPFNVNRSNTWGDIDNYEWDFDGVPDNREDVQFSYIFENPGPTPVDKPISLRVFNDHCDSTWLDTIQIYPRVTSIFEAVDEAGCHPFTAQFTNSSKNADNFRWSYGDGVNSNDTVFLHEHLYQNYDPENDLTFDVQLIAESQYRCSDTSAIQVTSWAKPNAYFYLPKSVSCPLFDFSVINSSEAPDGAIFDWTLGSQGSFNNTYEPVAEFDNTTDSPIKETISLRATSPNGCFDTVSRYITVYPYVDVNFTASPWSGCSPLSVNFTGDTTNVQKMVWYIDGDVFSTQISPSNVFLNESSSNDVHNVQIVAFSRYNCVDSSNADITVYPKPSVDFLASPVPAQYDTTTDATSINFTNMSRFQTTWDYEWDFGNGTIGSQSEANFEYTYGSYFWGDISNNYKIPVVLIASNKYNSECSDTIRRELLILPPMPIVEIGEDISGCIPLTVDFSSYTKYNYEDNYEWNFGDGTTVSNDASPTYVFDNPGTYTIKLNVVGDGGPAADYKIVRVYDNPEADFAFNDSIVMVASQTQGGDVVNFYNLSTNAFEYEWYFDSVDFYNSEVPNSTEKDPTWVYLEVGEYRPVLISYSTEGCADTLVHPKTILVKGEGIIEFPSGFFVHPSLPPSDEYNTDQEAGNMYLFYPKNNGIAEYRLEVYNRWGTKVFECDDVNRGWNGYIDGIPGKQDVYVWRARGRFTNGTPFDLSGDVTLFIAPVNITP